MDFKLMQKTVLEIQSAYRGLNSKQGNKRWEAEQYVQGFMGDVGQLAKLVMAKSGYRNLGPDINNRLEAELVDCLYATIVIANELGVDLEKAFAKNMADLKANLEKHP